MSEPRVVSPEYRTGYNGTGGALSQGYLVKRKTTGVLDEIILSTATSDAYMGVTANAIPDGEYGDIQVSGIAKVIAGASVTRGSRVMFGTGGKAITATTGLTFAGVAVTDGTTDELMEVELVAGGGGPVMP